MNQKIRVQCAEKIPLNLRIFSYFFFLMMIQISISEELTTHNDETDKVGLDEINHLEKLNKWK